MDRLTAVQSSLSFHSILPFVHADKKKGKKLKTKPKKYSLCKQSAFEQCRVLQSEEKFGKDLRTVAINCHCAYVLRISRYSDSL